MTVKKTRAKQSVKSEKKGKTSPKSSKKTTKKVVKKKTTAKPSLSRAAKSGQGSAVKINAASRKKAVGKAAGPKKTITTKKKTTPKKAVAKNTVDNGKQAIERRLRGRKQIAGTAKTKKTVQPQSKKALSSSTAARAGASADQTPKVPRKKKLLARDRNALRKILLEMRQHFSDQIEYLTKSSLERYDSVNSVEDGTDAFDRQFALTIAGSEQESLAAIDEALTRLDQGNYGWCESCNEMISIPRLKALPFVTTCVKCQSEMESGRRRKRVVV